MRKEVFTRVDGCNYIHRTKNYIPDMLKTHKNWVVWTLEERDGKTTKIPYSVIYDGKASSTNPASWGYYASAVEALNRTHDKYNGLGYVFEKKNEIIFIDIDDCIDSEGFLDERAKDILNAFHNNPTFCEVSQSGSGLHLLAIGTIPKSFKNSNNGVEMYDSARYCAITGNALMPFKPNNNQTAIDYVFNKYKTPDRPKKQPNNTSSRTCVSSMTDRMIIDKCMNSVKSGNLFRRLYSGEYQMYAKESINGHAESGHHIADLVLCSFLAFWCDRDKSQIDRIFRTSGLMRDKWNRDDYRENTLNLACEGCNESISEFINRKLKEEIAQYEKCFLQE